MSGGDRSEQRPDLLCRTLLFLPKKRVVGPRPLQRRLEETEDPGTRPFLHTENLFYNTCDAIKSYDE